MNALLLRLEVTGHRLQGTGWLRNKARLSWRTMSLLRQESRTFARSESAWKMPRKQASPETVPRRFFGQGALLLVLLALQIRAATQIPNKPSAEQTTFDENEPISRPVPISVPVLHAILATKAGKEGLRDARKRGTPDVAACFTASEVHLGTRQPALVVVGADPFAGADNTWFWLVLLTHKNPRVVLFTGGNSLNLLPNQTNGLWDIRARWSSPQGTETRIYKFNGAQYRLSKRSWNSASRTPERIRK